MSKRVIIKFKQYAKTQKKIKHNNGEKHENVKIKKKQ